MDYNKFDGVFRMMKTIEKLNRLANPIQLPLLYSAAGVAKILDHPAYNTNWVNNVINKIPNSLDFALKIAQPQYINPVPLHFVDAINRLNIHKNSLYNALDNYNRINNSIFSNSLIQSFDTTVFNITSKLINNNDVEKVKNLDKLLKEVASLISTDSKSLPSPNVIKKKLSFITRTVKFIESEALNTDTKKFIGYIYIILMHFCTLHGYYLALNPDETTLKRIEAKVDKIDQNKKQKPISSDTINGQILICEMDATIYKTRDKKSKKTGNVFKGQSVIIVENKVKWMMIAFENDEGEGISGWILK